MSPTPLAAPAQPVGTPKPPNVADVLHAGERAAWSLAALSLSARPGTPPALAGAARDVLTALGLVDASGAAVPGVETGTPDQVAAQAAGTLTKAAAIARGDGLVWSAQSDAALRAQGHASAQGARAFATFGLPHMADLAERLARPGARMLDVGTGVGALAVAYAREFPHLHVLGIDVLDRALALARSTLDAAAAEDTGLAARVSLRRHDVAELDDPDGFDLAWVPAPFVPEVALRPGLTRVASALRPGGWVMLAHGRFGDDPVDDAITTLQTLVYGGTPLDGPAARRFLRDAGLPDARTIPTPPGAPAVTVARRPG